MTVIRRTDANASHPSNSTCCVILNLTKNDITRRIEYCHNDVNVNLSQSWILFMCLQLRAVDE